MYIRVKPRVLSTLLVVCSLFSFAADGALPLAGEWESFLYSDGLTENEGPDGRTSSPRKLQKLLRGQSDLASLKRLVLAEGQAIWREQTPADDTCFLLVRWLGAPSHQEVGSGDRAKASV